MAHKELTILKTTIRLHPRYAETDQMGIVYHANYLVWFHEARDAMLTALDVDVIAAERNGLTFPVIESHCWYRAPARYGEEVLVSAVPLFDPQQSATIARLWVRYQITTAKSRLLLADGETINVITDRSGKLLLRIPAGFESMMRRINSACIVDTG